MQFFPTTQEDIPALASFIREAGEWSIITYDHIPPEALLANGDSLWFRVMEQNQYVGACGFIGISWPDRSADLCLGITPALRRKGIAKRLAREMNDFGFGTLGLRRLVVTATSDSPSIKIAQALGFKVEGVHKGARLRRGKWVDTATLALLAKE